MTSESCPQCGAVRAGPSRFCQSCQFHFDADPASPAAPASVAKKRPPAKIWAWLFVIGAGLWIFGTLSSNHAGSVPKAPAAPVAAWYPADFTVMSQDPTVAYRWMEKSEFDCTYSGACWGMLAIPSHECRTLYVELSVQDASGTVIGMTNDVVSGVAAGQRAQLVFDTFEKAAAKALIASVTCY